MIVIIEAYRAGLLKFKNWLPNTVTGLIVGIAALPLAMDFAIASGVKPEDGIYTAIISAFIVVFLAVVVFKLHDLQAHLLLFLLALQLNMVLMVCK